MEIILRRLNNPNNRDYNNMNVIRGCRKVDLTGKNITRIFANTFRDFDNLRFIYFADNRIETIDDQEFDNLINLKYLAFQYNYLTKIDARLYYPLRELQTLLFSANRIETIESGSFDNMAELEKLQFNGNYLRILPEGIFRFLKKLQHLMLSGNLIQDIDEDAFSQLENLQQLFLSSNHIKCLPKGIFNSLHNMVELKLSANLLKEIDANAFTELKELKVLNLSRNRMERLDKHLFKELINLEDLNLSFNCIEYLDVELFQSLGNLRSLYISGNKIKRLESELLFKNLIQLKSLNVSSNELEYIHPDVFIHLVELRDLHLSKNKLSSIAFNEDNPSLKELFLDNNCITSFDLSKLTGLRELYLFKNSISSLQRNQFSKLGQLKRLYLFNNHISEIDEYAFMNLKNLEELFLQRNQIEPLQMKVFEELGSLVKLYLFSNKIKSIKTGYFSNLKNLQHLYLFDNQISTIEQDALVGLVELKILLLNQNAIHNIDFLSVSSLRKLELLNLAVNKIATIPQNKLSSLKQLIMCNNSIEAIEEQSVSTLTKLEILDLSCNSISNIDFLRYIRSFCRNLREIHLSNNQLFWHDGEIDEQTLNRTISYDNIFKSKIFNYTNSNYRYFRNDEEINRLESIFMNNQFKNDEWTQNLETALVEESLDFFQYIPDGIRFSEVKTKLRMLTILNGGTQLNRKYFINMLLNQPENAGFLIKPLVLDNDVNEININPKEKKIFHLISYGNIEKYRKSIAVYSNTVRTNEEWPMHRKMEIDIGYTGKFNQFDTVDYNFEPQYCQPDLIYLLEKIKSNSIQQHSEFIKRQLLKKLFYNHLHCLINFDLPDQKEVENINELLKLNKLNYHILKPRAVAVSNDPNKYIINAVKLLNLDTKCIVNLEDLSTSEKLKIHLLLLKRDVDIIANISEPAQILLISEFDCLCHNDQLLIDEMLTSIRNNLVNKIQMQVIMTVNNVALLQHTNEQNTMNISKECFIEMYSDENTNQLFLRKYEGANRRLVQEIDHLNIKRAKIDSREKNELKEKIAELKADNLKRDKMNLCLQSNLTNLNTELIAVTKERDYLKELTSVTQSPITCNTREVISNNIAELTNFTFTPNELATYTNELNSKCKITKEEANHLIDLIRKEYKQLNGLAKDIICGSIINLTEKLYTSSTHYIHELMQNSEDASYDESRNGDPLVKIVVDRNYVIFASNEKGFTANNIKSLCGLSISDKEQYTHIGHKGIGFKSVFLCTNKPIIVSALTWHFQFILDKNDPLSYITPNNIIDNEHPAQLNAYLEKEKQLVTFMYLPLRDELACKEDYHKQIVESIDINVLLFTKNIKLLVIDDKIDSKQLKMHREFVDVEERPYVKDQQTVKIIDATLYLNNDIYEKYRVFKLKNKNSDKRSDEIVMAFPVGTETTMTYPIYSIFPIYNLNLKFLISAYWQLTTSRETLTEYNLENINLKDRVLEFILYIFQNDDLVGANVLRYLPKTDVNCDSWWKSFLRSMVKLLNPFCGEKFANKRIYNSDINNLVGESNFKLVDIEIIGCKLENDNGYLDEYGIRKVSINDALNLFQSDLPEIIEWRKSLDSEWWEKFFKMLKLQKESINNLDDLYNANIFLVNSKRQSIANIEKCFLFADEYLKDLCLSHDLTLIEYNSQSEKGFLHDHLQLNYINQENLMETILKDHLTQDLPKETLQRDFKYVKDNFTVYQRLVSKQPEYTLCVPIKNSSYASVEGSTMSTLFSYDLTSIPLLKEKSNYLFVAYPNESLRECLEYEILLCKLKCNLPDVNAMSLEEKINLQDKTLPLLKQFSSFTEKEIGLANELFELLPHDYIKTVIHKLPINTQSEIRSVSQLPFNSSTFTYPTFELMKRFGVKEKEMKSTVIQNETEFIQELNDDDDDDFNLFEDEIIDNASRFHNRRSNDNSQKSRHKLFSIENHDAYDPSNVSRLMEIYKDRIENGIACLNDDPESPRTRASINETSQLINFEERVNTGMQAELFFYSHLQHKYEHALDPVECWVSSFRSKLFKDSAANCNDAAGYDFVISDTKNCFSKNEKRCFIEVKGFATKWKGSFHITKNEVNKKDSVKNNNKEAYIIVIVEYVAEKERIRIAKIIDWGQNEEKLSKFQADSYEFFYEE